MGEEEKKKAPEAEEEAPVEAAAPAVKKGPDRKKLLFMGVGVIALVGAAAFFLLKPSGEPKEGEEKKPAGEEEVNAGAIGKKPPGVFLETDKEIVVNIAGTEATRHLRTRLTFELESEAVKLEMEERDPQIKDILIDVLSSRTLEKLDNAESRDEIKKELIKRFNQVLKSGKVQEIFFTDYVIQ